jgi:hypothetical protein
LNSPAVLQRAGFSGDHPLVLPAAEIALFISGLQNASVLHNDAESSGKAQAAEKFLGDGREEVGSPDFAAEFRKGPIFHVRFGVLHSCYLGQDHGTPGLVRLWHREPCSSTKILL